MAYRYRIQADDSISSLPAHPPLSVHSPVPHQQPGRQPSFARIAALALLHATGRQNQSSSVLRPAQVMQVQRMVGNRATHQLLQQAGPPVGLPEPLRAGLTAFSGLPLDDVRVHYNSARPATFQALACTQGTVIHIAPGQEQHLAHEAWHVVQQKQGRVQPTGVDAGVMLTGDQERINDDRQLEQEATVMGQRAQQTRRLGGPPESVSAIPVRQGSTTPGATGGAIQLLKVNGEEKSSKELEEMLSMLSDKLRKLAVRDQQTLDYVLSFPPEKRGRLSRNDISTRNPAPILDIEGSQKGAQLTEQRSRNESLAEEVSRLGGIDVTSFDEEKKTAALNAEFGRLSGIDVVGFDKEKNRAALNAEFGRLSEIGVEGTTKDPNRQAMREINKTLFTATPVLNTHKYEGRWQNGESDLGVFTFPGGFEIHIHFKHGTKQIWKAHTRGAVVKNLFQSNVATPAQRIPQPYGPILRKCTTLI